MFTCFHSFICSYLIFPFSHTADCNEKFASEADYNVHLNSHMNYRHKCHITGCGHAFLTRKRLELHCRVMHGLELQGMYVYHTRHCVLAVYHTRHCVLAVYHTRHCVLAVYHTRHCVLAVYHTRHCVLAVYHTRHCVLAVYHTRHCVLAVYHTRHCVLAVYSVVYIYTIPLYIYLHLTQTWDLE